tara:strand:- start:4504 stop:4893 length:390 start_codon:yes stop_codon:yes gene_type:complete
MMIDAQLWTAYLNPYFQFDERMECDSFAIVTGWNPASQWLSKDKNRRNNQQLRREIDHTYYVEVLVGDEDFSWAEQSFAIQINRERAIELGIKFGQNAIYFVEHGELYLLSCLSDGSCQKIEGWPTRCR